MQASHVASVDLMWFAILVIIVITGAIQLYFLFGKDADQKVELLPWAAALLGGLLIGFFLFVVPLPLPFLVIFALGAVVSAIVFVRQVKFCPKCARMIRQGPIYRVEYCPRCGHALDDVPQR